MPSITRRDFVKASLAGARFNPGWATFATW